MNKPTFKYKGNALDPNKEHELFSDSEFGFTVRLITTRYIVVCNNVTEVHWLYPRIGEQRVAIESDIQGTGRTVAISEIKFLEITDAKYLAEKFQI